jgi:hypothetical protein
MKTPPRNSFPASVTLSNKKTPAAIGRSFSLFTIAPPLILFFKKRTKRLAFGAISSYHKAY